MLTDIQFEKLDFLIMLLLHKVKGKRFLFYVFSLLLLLYSCFSAKTLTCKMPVG